MINIINIIIFSAKISLNFNSSSSVSDSDSSPKFMITFSVLIASIIRYPVVAMGGRKLTLRIWLSG